MKSFATHLWDRVDVVAHYSEERRRQIDDFISVINKRIDAEETYAKALQDIARLTHKIRQGQQSVSSLAFSTFKFDCTNRSGQAKIFYKSLKDEVLTPLKELLLKQNQQTKQLQKSYKKLNKELVQLQYQITKAQNKFHDQFEDKSNTLITNQILLQSMKTAKDKRLKIISKSTDIVKNLTDIEKSYQKAISQYNNFLPKNYHEVQNILELYQRHQVQRLARQQQNIMKTLIFQTSMMKNFQYDILTVTQQVQKAKQLDDITMLIEQMQSGNPKLVLKNSSLPRDLMAWSLQNIASKKFEKRIGFLLNKQLKTYIENIFKQQSYEIKIFQQSQLEQFKSIIKIVVQIWKGQDLKVIQSVKLKTLLKNQTNRLLLFLYLKQYLLTMNITLSEENYTGVTFLFTIFLDICHQNRDVFIARKITNLSFNFYIIRQQHKSYIHYHLNDCNIFKDSMFWKASVFESIQQELYLNYGNNIEQEFQMRQMSLIVGQLALFCHQMILLGCSNKNVRQLIGYFCKLYNVPDDRNKDLSRTVSTSYKKYRQMFDLTQTTRSVQSNLSIEANISEYDIRQQIKHRQSIDEIPVVEISKDTKLEPTFFKQLKP